MPTNVQFSRSDPPTVNPNPPLSLDQMAAGIIAVQKNALALLEDAKLLFQNGRYTRSVSLCILAQEEISKIPLIVQLLYVTKDGEDPLSTFCKKFRSHESKIVEGMTMYVLDDVLYQGGKRTKTMVSAMKAKPSEGPTFIGVRERGFYVEFDRNNKQFSSPNDAITQQTAVDFLANTEKAFSIYERFKDAGLPEVVQFLKQLIDVLGDEEFRLQRKTEAQKVQAVLRGN